MIPSATPQEIYQNSDSMLKHLPEKSLKVIQQDLLYSQKPVFFFTKGFDRRLHYRFESPTKHPSVPTGANFRDRETKFRQQLKNKYVYRIPLKYICDLGKINFPTKIDMKIHLTLERDLKKLFESDKNLHGALKTGGTATDIKDNAI